MTVVGHVAQLRQSRCYQASESLTCITCHDPHAPPAPDQLIEFHRTVCLSCHAEPSCRVPLEERTARNANHCAGCHMPQAPTDVPHIAFTHHRIGIHESTDRTQETVDFRPLTPMLETPQLSGIDRQASLGLAYFQFYREHSNKPEGPEHIARARPLIEAATREGLIDARLAAARAELASEARDAAAAQRWARQTLAAADLTAQEKEAALRILSAIALTEQRPAEAAMHLEELTSLRRDPQHWFLLGLARQRLQDLPGAAAAFERVLEIDPAEPETYLALAPIYGALGEPAREAQCRERARQIREAASANSEEGKEK
jgi:predicted CXXCH cytochrome family protein